MRHAFPKFADCIHVWAQQSQDSGYASSVSFEGEILYSYRTSIARIVNGDTVLIGHNGWGDSCANCTNLAISATSHMNRVDVLYVTADTETKHRANLDWLRDTIIETAGKAERARQQKAWRLKELEDLYQDFEDYAKLFHLEAIAFADYRAVLNADIKALRAERAETERLMGEAEKERKYQARVENVRRYRAWKRGANNRFWGGGLPFTALRLTPDKTAIETSKEVKVPVRIASALWGLIVTARAERREIIPRKPFMINHIYQLDKVTEEGDLEIKCHFIPYFESRDIARQLGLTV